MYTTIIHQVRKDLSLSCNEYIVLDQISRLSSINKYGGWCVASKKQISSWLDLTERGVFKIINRLISMGLVEKGEGNTLRPSDVWNLKISSCKHEENYEQRSLSMNNVHEQRSYMTMNNVHENHEQRSYNNKNNKNLHIHTQEEQHTSLSVGVSAQGETQKDVCTHFQEKEKESSAKEKESRFQEFWRLYPKKKQLDRALKAWRKLNDGEKQQAIEVLPSHKIQEDWLKEKGRFIPHPATWLNAGSWKDVLDVEVQEPTKKYKTDEDYEREFLQNKFKK